MQTDSTQQILGCIGKCITGLTPHELDRITDNVTATLLHDKGRLVFKQYLKQSDLQSDLACLEIYETCNDFIAKGSASTKNSNAEDLIEDAEKIKEMVEDLDGIPEIDFVLLEKFNEALNSNSRDALFSIMTETLNRTRSHLTRVHVGFKRYASKPCPLAK